jgi:hypothetical protein
VPVSEFVRRVEEAGGEFQVSGRWLLYRLPRSARPFEREISKHRYAIAELIRRREQLKTWEPGRAACGLVQ